MYFIKYKAYKVIIFCNGVGRNGETTDLAIGRLRLVRHILKDDRQLFFIAEALSNHI